MTGCTRALRVGPIVALCGRTPARLYLGGRFCPLHTPAARAGRPEAPTVAPPPLPVVPKEHTA